jgi:hypothetical protein
MNPTRRSLCGLGIASLPLAMIDPGLVKAARKAGNQEDELLAVLVRDTVRNCRLAARPGRGRAGYVRALGANVDMLAAYLHSRPQLPEKVRALAARVRAEGPDRLAFAARDAWPAVASDLATQYGVQPPGDLDHAVLVTAALHLARHGVPRMHGVRRLLDREADRLEAFGGAAAVPVRQTPGNDFGPAGWSAGIGDPNEPSCYDLGILMALLMFLELIPELATVAAGIMAAVAMVAALACGPLET